MSSQQATPNPRVGIAAMIVDAQDKILIGKRKGSHGAGESPHCLLPPPLDALITAFPHAVS